MTDEEMSIYEIALFLHTPVYKLVEMPYEELLGWYNYLDRRPYEWRADDRASKLLQAQGVKEKPARLFASLKAIYEGSNSNLEPGQTDVMSLKHSVLFQNMLTATGGDKLDL